jgi:glycine amidinotransferase
MHIDSSIMPLAPGKLLVNPDYIDPSRLPPMFAAWDILIAPEPDPVPWRIPSMCGRWLSINVLMLDERRVIVERSQVSMIKNLKYLWTKPQLSFFGQNFDVTFDGWTVTGNVGFRF